jgi:hypothetical protein
MMNIKKIIKEEIEDFDWFDEGETPLSWLIDNYGDLTPVVKGDKTVYVDNNNKLVFYYQNDRYCYINYNKIWGVLKARFGSTHVEVKEITTTWLDEVYGIRGLIPVYIDYL